MRERDIIVIGTSAGGVEALITLTSMLPANLEAAVFIVLHMSAQSPSLLSNILSRTTSLNVVVGTDNAKIDHGTVYVAQPDRHLLVEREHVRVVHGPKENRHRPAIDVLFRSAAQAYGPSVIGVVLTGSLDDGTAGLAAIKQYGGLAVVQDPEDAFFPSMPESAIAHVNVDHIVPLNEIGALLGRLVRTPIADEGVIPVSEETNKEVHLEQMDSAMMYTGERAGNPSVFSCPECGGVLWELEDGNILRFRCRVGHAFSIETMFDGQTEAVENALWVALKTLQENAELSRRMAQHAHEHGRGTLAHRYEQRLHEVDKRIQTIAQVLKNGNERNPSLTTDINT